MAPHKDYKGLIWTTHVIERLNQRKIPQEWAWKTYHFPDQEIVGKEPRTKELQKMIDGKKITLIIKKTERDEWLLLSVWADPPFSGSIDDKKKKYYSKPETPALFRFINWLRKSFSSGR